MASTAQVVNGEFASELIRLRRACYASQSNMFACIVGAVGGGFYSNSKIPRSGSHENVLDCGNRMGPDERLRMHTPLHSRAALRVGTGASQMDTGEGHGNKEEGFSCCRQ